MGEERNGNVSKVFLRLGSFMRKLSFGILSVGPIPTHIAFIMDGNRRYAKKKNLEEGAGHRAGFLALMSLLNYCYELGVKYATVYAFSIDNFKRKPEEVQQLMDLMQEKIEGLLEEGSIVNQYGIRVYFIGNLKLLNESVRAAAEKAMKATANNTKCALLICVAYTSTDEIAHAVHECCQEKKDEMQEENADKMYEIQTWNEENFEEKQKYHRIKLVDLEKHMYMAVAPNPDILIRSSGETRLSNFLLWQTNDTLLCCPRALWPEIGFWHLVWAVLNFQRNYSYLEKKKKQL
ncbi:dehydrodolichyl diphosphate synthase 6 isoform X2 [Diospyros lotus]|nr:dehydrodolichyl diphosphate synthase 6 isoform X2 [Diospyros lotus]XP_052191203.1 dehydrodolichyl diphosphate synthase 6 isoform X2 [Diospyros lotus]XP_052191204.1 dehydrodolichyl diphosphate synthase 6 isoform X2 [Diospyros lotus]